MEMIVGRTTDFNVTGKGDAEQWAKADWHTLPRVGDGKSTYRTRAKVMYSETGIYFLVECEDRRLTCTIRKDNENIFTEDVVEIFLWPDESQPLYFEYEISPLDVELPILVPNHNGVFHGWLPWHYEGERRIQHATSVRGGEKRSMAAISGWTCEFKMPFALFRGMGNMPPKPGASWRGNLYRIDYDEKPTSQWAWSPKTGGNFHDFRCFGTLRFE